MFPEAHRIIYLQNYFPHHLVARLLNLYPGEYLDVSRVDPVRLTGARVKQLPTRGLYAKLTPLFQGNLLRIYTTSAQKYQEVFHLLPKSIQEIHQAEMEKTVAALNKHQLDLEIGNNRGKKSGRKSIVSTMETTIDPVLEKIVEDNLNNMEMTAQQEDIIKDLEEFFLEEDLEEALALEDVSE